MSPSPYAIVAYRPASRTENTTNSVKRCTTDFLLAAVRVRRDALAGRRIGRSDDRRAPVGLVLLHHERRVRLLPELGREGQLTPRQDGGDLHRRQLLADLGLIERARLFDRHEEGAGRLVAEGLVPLRIALVLGLEPVDELLVQLALLGEQRAPPNRAQDVLHVLLAQGLGGLLLAAARAVARHFVAHARGHV